MATLCAVCFFGFDPSLTGTGMAAVKALVDPVLFHAWVKNPAGPVRGFRVIDAPTNVVRTESKSSLTSRLSAIQRAVSAFSREYRPGKASTVVAYFVEGFARGFSQRREEMGMAHACVRLGLSPFDATDITPRAVKTVVCPLWPGLNKANWAAAGRTGKWKSSMPDKAAVGSGLFRLFGLAPSTPDGVDAVCVALAGACVWAARESRG